MRTLRVLVVEDDAPLGTVVERGLADAGFTVERCADGAAGLASLAHGAFDACVLDGRLPGLGGLDVLAQARAAGVRTPVLMLTARDAVPDRVRGLELGADDYLTKPFAFAELVARVRAITRRGGAGAPAEARLAWRDLALDVPEHRVTRAGAAIDLSAKQFALLEALLRHGRAVASRSMLLREVFGYSFDPGTNIVDVHVAQLRKRIDRAGEASLVETVRGVGYRMAGDG